MSIIIDPPSFLEKNRSLPILQEEKRALKIKDIAHIAFFTLASAFTLLGITGVVVFFANPALMPLGLTFITISLIALSVLGIAVFSEYITPHIPDCLAVIVNQIRAFVKEIFALLALIAIFPIDLTKERSQE